MDQDNQTPQTGNVPAVETKPVADTKQADLKQSTDPKQAAGSTPDAKSPAADSGQTPAAETPSVNAPSWQEVLDTVDAKELRKHPRYAGILGSDLQRALQQRDERESQKQMSERRDKEEKNFLELVEGHTDYIKENYPLVYQRYQSLQEERAVRDLDGIKGKTIDDVATALGHAMRDVPEWAELSPEDHEAIARELIGKPVDQVLTTFLKATVSRFINIGSTKKLKKWQEEELSGMREALRQEITAQLMKSGDAPDMTRPKSSSTNNKLNVDAMSPEEFSKYWESLKTPKR